MRPGHVLRPQAHLAGRQPFPALLPELFHVQASPTEFPAARPGLAGAAAFAVQAQAAEEVSLYTTREPKLIQPLLDAFTKESGIKVNTVFVKDGLLERVKAEGAKSPADVLMTVDIGNLLDLVDGGVTQPVKSETLESVIPANLRGADGKWYALSLRDRVLYVEKT